MKLMILCVGLFVALFLSAFLGRAAYHEPPEPLITALIVGGGCFYFTIQICIWLAELIS